MYQNRTNQGESTSDGHRQLNWYRLAVDSPEQEIVCRKSLSWSCSRSELSATVIGSPVLTNREHLNPGVSLSFTVSPQNPEQFAMRIQICTAALSLRAFGHRDFRGLLRDIGCIAQREFGRLLRCSFPEFLD